MPVAARIVGALATAHTAAAYPIDWTTEVAKSFTGYIVIAWPGIDLVRALRWLCIATVLFNVVFSAGVVVGYHLRKCLEKLPEREREAVPEPEPEATSQRREVAHAETATVVSEAPVSVDFSVPPPPPSPPTVYMA